MSNDSNKESLESVDELWAEPGFGLRSLIAVGETDSDGFQLSLRPKALREYIGQGSVVRNLDIAISAAKKRAEPLDHVLLHGPPGLGKTSLAQIIAIERGVNFKATSGPVLERAGDLAAILNSLESGDVLFIDEIHRLNRVVEEVLYPAMEDRQIDIIIGQGPASRSVKVDLQPFTLVAATTRIGLLTSPLRNRFGIVERLEFYSQADLEKIVTRSAKLLEVALGAGGASEIARRARGTPRVANRLLRRARDYATERADGIISQEIAEKALRLLEIDSSGLDKMDRMLLTLVIEKFSGGPVGVETIAAALSEDKSTVEDVYEPYLLQSGFLMRTPRGRMVTEKAYEHLGISLPNTSSQQGLFEERGE